MFIISDHKRPSVVSSAWCWLSLGGIRFHVDGIAGITVLLKFVAQRSYRNAQRGCRLRPISPGLPQCGADRLFLELVKSQDLAAPARHHAGIRGRRVSLFN